jgi:hypothetical protein
MVSRVGQPGQGAAPLTSNPDRRRYSKQEILDAVHRWVELYGTPPCGADWEPARARRTGNRDRVERFESGEWPTNKQVRLAFGTFNAAIIASGHEPQQAPSRITGRFNREQILEALQEWAARYGEPPVQADWDPYRARCIGQEWRIGRYEQGDWPSARSVCRHFGRFSNAISAAGLEPRSQGDRPLPETPARRRLRRIVAEHRRSDAGGGPGLLAARLTAVAHARKAGDLLILRGSLIQLASAALSWADRLNAKEIFVDPQSENPGRLRDGSHRDEGHPGHAG